MFGFASGQVSPGGTGLGLAASRAALTGLGGTIEIVDSSDADTTIQVTLHKPAIYA